MSVELLNIDCMEYMKGLDDNAFELACVDPPYGIGMSGGNVGYKGGNNLERKEWDAKIPPKEYFDEVKRVSKNQIIWGGNYFNEYLDSSRCWICWNKDNTIKNFSSVEFAWCSFDRLPNYFYYAWGGLSDGVIGRNKKQKSIHPTQKPVKLYEWLLANYAKEGDKILDTHGGSMSSMIACHYGGFDAVCCELDKDYFEAGKLRFEKATSQLAMF